MKRFALIVLLTGIPALMFAQQAGRSGGWRWPERQGEVVYTGDVVAKHSGKCMEIDGGETRNGGNITQYDCNGGDNQKWEFRAVGNGEYAIINVRSGKGMDVVDRRTNDGANIQQWAYGGGANQRWRIEPAFGGYYRIVNVNSGKCADVEREGKWNRATVHQWSCTGRDNQMWRISSWRDGDEDDNSGGWWGRPGRGRWRGEMVNRNSGLCLDVAYGSKDDRGNVQQWDCLKNAQQEWRFVQVERGEYRIENRNSGKVLDVAAASMANAANVQQFEWNGTAAQRWRMEPRGRTGWYQIVNVNSGKCLDVAREARFRGANVQQWDCNGSAAQQWKIGR